MEQNTTFGTKKTTGGLVSIVIPVFNEMAMINERIQQVQSIAESEPFEIIVVDGGPGHLTLASIEDSSVLRVRCEPGRGTQMNAGALEASGEFLLFLHADTELPCGALEIVKKALKGRAEAGAFSLSIDSTKFSFGVVSWFANLRTRLERIPYGDQAQFMTADLFRKLGGHAEIPIMEDVELFKRIRQLGLPISIVSNRVKTSPRRWEEEGIVRRTLLNWLLRIRYWFGASPEKLKTWYRPQEPQKERKKEENP